MAQPGFDFFRDPTASHHHGDPESTQAHTSIREFKARMHREILEFAAKRGALGMTCDEAEAKLGMAHQTCSARFVELKAAGYLTPTGSKRPTRSGRKAKVYVLARSNPA